MSRAPYKYLDYYTFEDADLFFGREEEVQRMVGEILSSRLLVLFSPSGSGKTSLINAGLRPALEQMGYKTIYVRPENDPTISVIDAVTEALELPKRQGKKNLCKFLVNVMKPRQDENFDETEKPQPLVIFLDQFEEFFIVFRDKIQVREKFIDQLAKIKYEEQLPVFFVLSLRDDYFVNLHEFRKAIPSIFHSPANIRLEPFSNKEARRAIKEPLKAVKGGIEKEVVDALIRDLKNGKPGIEPITLQIVCHTLWAQRTGGSAQITYQEYRKCGRAQKILKNHFTSLIQKIPWWQRRFMIRIFEALKTPDDTKRYRTFEDLQTTLKIKNRQRLHDMLDKLSNLQLLRFDDLAGTKWYEFKHDYLVHEFANWLQRRKERIARNSFRYGVIPSCIFFLGIIIYLLWNVSDYNKFNAAFSATKSLVGPQAEIEVSRVFNPFNDEIITTGYYKKDLRDPHAAIDIQRNELGLKEDDWNALIKKLNVVRAGEFLYKTGDSVSRQAAVASLKTALLEDPNNEIRFQALDVLKVFAQTQNDTAAITALVEALKDTDNTTGLRAQAAEILGGISISDNDQRVIPALINVLETDKKDLWSAAVSSLVKLGESDQQIRDALKSDIVMIRLGAAKALVSLGQSNQVDISFLTRNIRKRDTQLGWVRSEACLVLGKVGIENSRTEIIDSLVDALNEDSNNEVLAEAAAALGMLDQKDFKVVEALVKVLQKGNKDLRSAAAGALVDLGKSNKKIIDELVKVLKDTSQSRWVRSETAEALERLSESYSQGIIDKLLGVMNEKDVYARYLATRTLGKVGNNEKVIDMLEKARLTKYQTYWRVRYEANKALVTLGKAKRQPIRYLVNILKYDESIKLRSEVAETFQNFEKKDSLVISALQRAAQIDNSPDVRSLAVEALGNLAKNDLAEYDDIVASLGNDESEKVRSKAAEALGNVSADSLRKFVKIDTVINVLKKALKDESADVRSRVALTMGRLGSDQAIADSVRSALNEALSDPDSGVRANAAKALGQSKVSGRDSVSVIVELMETLKDSESDVRGQAASALGTLWRGRLDKNLVADLKNRSSGYRTAAAHALAQKVLIEHEKREDILGKIESLMNDDKHPWVRLGAWKAYELIQPINEVGTAQQLTDKI